MTWLGVLGLVIYLVYCLGCGRLIDFLWELYWKHDDKSS